MKQMKKLSEREIEKIKKKSLKEVSKLLKLLKNKDIPLPKVSDMHNLKESIAIFQKCFNDVRKNK